MFHSLRRALLQLNHVEKTEKGIEEATSLPRFNGSAQDALQLLDSLQFQLNFLSQQLPTFHEVQSGQATLGSWDGQYKK
jgi:protein transport protein SEC20